MLNQDAGQRRVSIVGPSGAGKSTSARIAAQFFSARGYSATVVKLAEPLYKLQNLFYATAGREHGVYQQDQRLLELIATELRRISPTSLADDFEQRLRHLDASVVINDDLRDIEIDYARLRELGFRFIRLQCRAAIRAERLSRRGDTSVVTDSRTTDHLSRIEAVADIDTSDFSVEDLREALTRVLEALP